LQTAVTLISEARRPIIIAGGGVHYSGATEALAQFASHHQIPVAETQAGKGAVTWDHPCNVGAIGVTGSSAANKLINNADLVIAIGTRLQDFTTGSGLLLGVTEGRLLSINVARHDVIKRSAHALRGDASRCVQLLDERIGGYAVTADWANSTKTLRDEWNQATRRAPATPQYWAWSIGVLLQMQPWCALLAECRANCTSCGVPPMQTATTRNMAIPAWATRSLVEWASRWRCPGAMWS
jgi:3D-(3,5/4)-trihydroxycyclohexane-1,2-dione acylhydrolase (decyclizing)